jgi:Tfp pilus assembly protein PilN
MLSLHKKPSDKKDAEKPLAWHPDFREVSKLPDIKTVRTTFFVNTVAVFIVVAFLIFIVVREFNISTLNSEIDRVEKDISEIQKANDRAVIFFTRYQTEEKRFNDALSLAGDSVVLSALLSHLADLLPIGSQLDVLNFRGKDQPVTLTIRVHGIDSAASNIATQLVKTLQADATLLKEHDPIKLDSSNRSESEGAFKLELSLRPKSLEKTPIAKK